MSTIGTNQFKQGIRIEVDGEPYTIVSVEFVKPGKGQAFTRVKIKHLKSGRVIERTFKSNEKFPIADVVDSKMRMLYKEQDSIVFMDDQTFEQLQIPRTFFAGQEGWLKEETIYDIIFYKGNVIECMPPTFLEMKIVQTDPGARGDSSGRVLKPAITETGAKIQVPIFIDEGEVIKVDTRTGEYVSRV